MGISRRNILISACLLGSPVRYNGTDLRIEHPLITQWKTHNQLISVCPETIAGMSTPRAPAEIQGGDGLSVLRGEASIMDNTHQDVTQAFITGAKKALQLAQAHHCVVAILTERSPSCGSHFIYDGTFSGIQQKGMGVTARLLTENGIKVFNQHQLEEVAQFLAGEKPF